MRSLVTSRSIFRALPHVRAPLGPPPRRRKSPSRRASVRFAEFPARNGTAVASYQPASQGSRLLARVREQGPGRGGRKRRRRTGLNRRAFREEKPPPVEVGCLEPRLGAALFFWFLPFLEPNDPARDLDAPREMTRGSGGSLLEGYRGRIAPAVPWESPSSGLFGKRTIGLKESPGFPDTSCNLLLLIVVGVSTTVDAPAFFVGRSSEPERPDGATGEVTPRVTSAVAGGLQPSAGEGRAGCSRATALRSPVPASRCSRCNLPARGPVSC